MLEEQIGEMVVTFGEINYSGGNQFAAESDHKQFHIFLHTRPTFRFTSERFKNMKIYPPGLNYFQWYVPISSQKYGAY